MSRFNHRLNRIEQRLAEQAPHATATGESVCEKIERLVAAFTNGEPLLIPEEHVQRIEKCWPAFIAAARREMDE